MSDNPLPNLMREWRRRLWITQKQAAARFGMPWRTWQEIELGRSPGTAFTRKRLLEVVTPKK